MNDKSAVCRRQLTNPHCSLDARSAPISQARHKPGPWLEGRSSLRLVAHGDARRRTTRHSGDAAAASLHRPLRYVSASDWPIVDGSDEGGGGGSLLARLHIDSVSSEDNGLYTCHVDYRGARSRLHDMALVIIGEFGFGGQLFVCICNTRKVPLAPDARTHARIYTNFCSRARTQRLSSG